jgi:protein TonB
VIEGPASTSLDAFMAHGVGTPVALGVPPAPEIVRPPAAHPPALVRVGHGVREPRKIVDVAPIYPPIALSARIEGAVILEAVINERGEIERVKVLRSQPLLDGAAVDAVRRWRYSPTLLNGAPVSVLMTITINFTLRQ